MMRKYVKLSYIMEMYKQQSLQQKTISFVLLFFMFILTLLLLHHFIKYDSCTGEVVSKYHYRYLRHQDVSGKDLMHVQSSDMAAIQRVCDLFEECAAFNSNGWLKKSDNAQKSKQANLYIKLKPMQSQCKVAASSQPQTEYSDMMKNMKIYVYPTTVGGTHRPRRTGGYAVERKFVEALNRSPFLTSNPKAATFFFIPIRCSSYIIGASSEHEGIIQAKRLIGEMLEEIKTNFPYWSWSSGADHFYICAHEIGAGISDGVLKNAIALVNTADYDDPYFMPHKDISLPPTPASGSSALMSLKGGSSSSQPRVLLAFYAGDLQSGRIRPMLYNRWSGDKEILLVKHTLPFSTYSDYIKRSKYCLVIRGREAWSTKLVEAIFAGCVPVLISNHYHLPLQGIIDWKEFSVIVPESEIFQLKSIIKDIPSSKYMAMQSKLAHVYSRFVWSNPPRSNDAFYSVMLQLWRRRHVTQYRTSRDSVSR